MAIGDLYVLTLKQSVFGNEFLNVFTYLQSTENTNPGFTSPGSLIQAFQIDVLTSMDNVQIDDVQYDNIEVYNAFNEAELASDDTLSPATGGFVATDILPLFVAWEFRTNRATRAIRRGYKRLSGLDETMVENGAATAALEALLATCAAAFSANIQWDAEPLTPTFQPVIVKRIPYTTPTNGTAYRLPLSAAEMGSNYFAPTFEYLRVSTQNSRKSF